MELPAFASYFWAGYECAYATTEAGLKLDLLSSSKHDEYCRIDYTLIKELGITVAREGLAWSQIDHGKTYDFSRFEKMMQIGKEEGIQQIWDLNHFDYPSYLDPFSPQFVRSFGEYAKRAISVIRKYQSGTLYIAPVNEISFFAWIGADQGIWAPAVKGKGWEFKQQLIRLAITAMEAIWSVDSNVRFIQIDPYLYRRPPLQTSPGIKKMAREFSEIRFQAWDILAGRIHPELGGNPKYVDIIGVNYYPQNQEWIIPRPKKGGRVRYTMIPWHSPYRVSFAAMLGEIYTRYKRPMVVTETGGWGALRAKFWQRTLAEVSEARTSDIPICGICAYPIVDRPDWFDAHLVNSGFWDFKTNDPSCVRIPYKPAIDVVKEYIARWG